MEINRKPFHEHGFTIIELLIALSLFGLVVSGGFSIYYFADKAFVSSTIKTDLERSMQIAMINITNSLRTAHEAEIVDSLDEIEKEIDESDTFLLIVDSRPALQKWEEGGFNTSFLIDYYNDDFRPEYELRFSKVEPKDAGNAANVIQISLAVKHRSFEHEITESISLLNVGQKGVQGSGSKIMRYVTTFEPPEYDPGDFPRRCFIATAVFGGDSSITELLRDYRDKFLLTNGLGRSFVDFYYTYSPGIAAVLDGSFVLRVLAGIALIPFVLMAFILVNLKWVSIVCLIVAVLWYRVRKYVGKSEG